MIHLDTLSTLVAATLVLLLGRKLVHSVSLLKKYTIPEPVAGGLLVALALLVLKKSMGWEIDFDMSLKDPLMLAFFATIGLNANLASLRAGGKVLGVFLIVVVGLLLIGGGWLLRMGWGRNVVSASPVVWGAVSTALLCVGLGVVTGAPVVIGLTAVLGLAQWTAATDVPASESAAEPSRRANGVYALEMLAAVVVIQLLKGLVPLQ